MSSINNVSIYGLEESVAASGYPMSTEIMNLVDLKNAGEKSHNRADRLAAAPVGSGHDQFLTSIIVQFDLTFSLKVFVNLVEKLLFEIIGFFPLSVNESKLTSLYIL